MTTTDPDAPTPRERALFALMVLGDHLRADVLRDGDVVARYGFDPSRSMPIGAASAPRDTLFDIFRRLADGEAGPLALALKEPEGASAEVTLEGDNAIVMVEKRRHKFDNAAMMSASPKRRLAVLEAAFDERPLCRAEQEAQRALSLIHI